jgi:hypothetical protein
VNYRHTKTTFSEMVTESVDLVAYHNGSGMHARQSIHLPKDRQFIAWDGEGAKGNGSTRPQEYVLLGCSTGERLIGPSLRTEKLLAFIIQIGKKYPGAYHVGFAFDYDTNMILRNLSPNKLRILKNRGSVLISNYRVEHVSSKWLQITQYGQNYKKDKNDRFTIRIADIFGFFQCSFVAAVKSYIPDHPLMAELNKIEEGKAERKYFTYDKIDYIESYWVTEIALLLALVERLREMLYSVDLNVTRWHGPGAIANFVYRTQGIASHKALTPEPVREAARYGYAGGRFELYRLGRHTGVYGIDINSAYPAAISRLPSLSEGTWEHVLSPTSVVEFGIYHVRLSAFAGPVKKPSPLFHRDFQHNISYPWFVEGWYWSPEIELILPMLGKKGLEIVEGYEYVGWHSRPFGFVEEMYYERKRLKREGNGAEKALKLALNSLYGKMAQRVGWERNGRPPTWHQLEWAGFVTSATRARLYSVMARIPWENLIAVETDGIYTTADPASLGITDSPDLGEWEFSQYEEMMYVQSGVYFARDRDKGWSGKYRGLDNGTLNADGIGEYLRGLGPNPTADKPWDSITGPTTRFIGYKAALHRQDQNMGPMKVHHCVWETTPREISPGEVGKRVHSPKLCAACRAGANAYEMPHDLVIRSRSIGNPVSEMHSIPWEDRDNEDSAEWRQYAKAREDLLR